MTVHLFAFHKRSHQFQTGKARLAPVLVTQKRASFLSDAPLIIDVGVVYLEAEGVQRSAFYDVPATGFFWRSKDGLVTCTNEEPFSGGALVDSGNGVGTSIVPLMNEDPAISNVFAQDEDL